jgi:glycosyltransferase involved in cell wall biosynthesis
MPTSVPRFHPLDPLELTINLMRLGSVVYFSPGTTLPLPVLNTPVVFVVHDLIPVLGAESTVAKRLYYDLIVRRHLKTTPMILTVSSYSRTLISEWARIPEDRIAVVGSGIGPGMSPDGAKHEPGYPYILYVGNQTPHKNIPRLLSAFGMITQDLRDLKLVMSGRASDTTLDLVRRAGLDDRVVFAGTISGEDLPCYYRGALALVIPSLAEGFGLPALEALGCGIPVVAANASSLPEVIGEAGIFVDPTDVESIAQGIQRACTDTGLREVLRRAGPTRASRFTWDRTAALVYDVISSVL